MRLQVGYSAIFNGQVLSFEARAGAAGAGRFDAKAFLQRLKQGFKLCWRNLGNLHRKTTVPLNACATGVGSDGDELLAIHQEFNFFMIADMNDTLSILPFERKGVKEF
ncbi:MAG: hypothetical protein WCI85_07400 [Comamonadaceae bacterium]